MTKLSGTILGGERRSAGRGAGRVPRNHAVDFAVRCTLGLLGSTLVSTSLLAQEQQSGTQQGAVATGGLEEIVVTAQRRTEKVQDVPISISAFSSEQMDTQGVRAIDDIARLTPGITFQRTDARNSAMSSISIRGIASSAGAATTGIYIDDTPVQVRALGAGATAFNAFPQVFDLDRVEVLRGPQGTLFGAGSEGGTVRFITPQPSLTHSSGYVRSELGYTQGGDPSYEAGAAFGAPVVEDKFAFRVSAWFRRDGGWVDRTDWDHGSTQVYPPTAPTPASVTNTLGASSDWQNSSAVKGALLFSPVEGLAITPSIYYQKMLLNDTSAYWSVLSDPGSDSFKNGNAINAPSNDRFYLPALKIDWAFAGLRLISNTSYFNRNSVAINDYTAFETALWGEAFSGPRFGTPPYLNGPFYPAGYTPASTLQVNKQNNITEELRLQSDDPTARINWVVGAFFAHSRQTSEQFVADPELAAFIGQLTGGIPFAAVFGQPLLDGKYTFVQDPEVAHDKQLALYGQADFKLTDKLTLTAGLRATDAKFTAAAHYEGPVVGPPVSDTGSQTEHPVTPKGGLSYKLDESNMVYATAAKGFRIGGYNPRVGAPCATDPNFPGYQKDYGSDSVWSYEIGSKNELFDHKLRLSTSVYYIDWKNIQQSVALATCGFGYVANLGKAESKGFDLQADMAVTRDFLLGLSVGYNDAKFTQTVQAVAAGSLPPTSAPSPNLVTNGDHIAGWPWNVAFSAQYSFLVFGDRDGYIRADYQYQARQTSLTAQNDPANGGFQAWNVFQLPQTSQLSVRSGVRWQGFDVSLFCNNLTDTHPVLSQTPSIKNAGVPAELLDYQYTTFRPRTYGVTASYRF
jgi:iron complex outermembrane recepter protein